MPAKTPVVAMPLVEHAAGTDADFINVADFKTGVVKAGAIRFNEAHHVMIAVAFAAAHECHNARRTIRQFHTDNARIKIGLPVEIGREAQRVAQAPGLHRQIARRVAHHARAVEVAGVVDFPFRCGRPRRGCRVAHIDQRAVGVAKSDAVGRRFARCVDEFVAMLFEASRDVFDGVGARTQAHVVQALLAAFYEYHLILIAACTTQDDALTVVTRLHAEICVKRFASVGVRHGECDVL